MIFMNKLINQIQMHMFMFLSKPSKSMEFLVNPPKFPTSNGHWGIQLQHGGTILWIAISITFLMILLKNFVDTNSNKWTSLHEQNVNE